uniref:Small ribosomal subunit protein uS9c n=2 Tax=Ostreobium TaxID=121087 RepID=A0A1A8H0H3_9CHLO|nr:Ribosomal protein S9 [Ostreobium quekettii]ANG44440.1 ribosomal protein S9 [Ostreobium sp. OS1B]SBQ76968.1 Ribosomal protein S9 [Ostreobium quekettii]
MVIGLGRRKKASAKVKLIPGTGEIIINKPITNYSNQQNLVYRSTISKPLESLGLDKNYDVIIHVCGGGTKGQIEAAQLGVARAVCQINSSYRIPLKLRGYLTRDARSKERRKYGLKKARKASQFSKR